MSDERVVRPVAGTPGIRTLEVPVGRKVSGETVYESLLVEEDGLGHYVVKASPAFAQGVARGDVVTQPGPRTEVEVMGRGGNLVLQVFAPHPVADELLPTVTGWGGSLDGRGRGVTAFTVPVGVGFEGVETVMNDWAVRHPGVEWYFGNVYAADGVTPLGWW